MLFKLNLLCPDSIDGNSCVLTCVLGEVEGGFLDTGGGALITE